MIDIPSASSELLKQIDGHWFDICSLIGGLIYAVIRWARHARQHKLISKETGLDIANGVGLFPLLVLSFASFSTTALNALLQSNRLILSVAGIVALLAVLED